MAQLGYPEKTQLGYPENAGWWLSSQPAVNSPRSGLRKSPHLNLSMYSIYTTLFKPKGAQSSPHGNTASQREGKSNQECTTGEQSRRYMFLPGSW